MESFYCQELILDLGIAPDFETVQGEVGSNFRSISCRGANKTQAVGHRESEVDVSKAGGIHAGAGLSTDVGELLIQITQYIGSNVWIEGRTEHQFIERSIRRG